MKKPRSKKGFYLIKTIVGYPNGKQDIEWEYIPKVKYEKVKFRRESSG